ncbi:MAG: polysaccharide biosynthesis/export family protein [Gemmatimonadetes bacterium]|nr:polysaccharide biosynthesis/export family protein [Gemmatimonadota bacterium]
MMIRLPLLALLFLALAPEPIPAQAVNGSRLSANSLLPGDVIDVRIWLEPDLSGKFQVDEDGAVVLPLLGRKQVVGISPQQLRDRLIEEYRRYLINPSVNITLLRRINVLGEIRVPGLYTVDATVSVADVIAMAQGLAPDGDANDIVLVRSGKIIRSNLTGTMVIAESDIRSGDQIIVGKRTWASRNIGAIVGIVSILASVAVTAVSLLAR